MEKNSYTSSSNKWPIAFLAFLVVFICVEVFISISSTYIIKQKRNLLAFKKFTSSGPLNIVCLGKSYVETGIDTKMLSELLSKKTPVSKVRAFNLGIGNMPTGVGYFLIKNIVVREKPSLIIFGFVGEKPLGRIDINSAASYHTLRDYVRYSDIPELFKTSVFGFDDRADVILRKLSYSYSYRFIIRYGINLLVDKVFRDKISPIRLILSRIYRVKSVEENAGFVPLVDKKSILVLAGGGRQQLGEKKQDNGFGDINNSQDYYYLIKIIELAKRKDINLVFIALPSKETYRIPESARNILKENGIPLLDFSQETKFNDFFVDEIHLQQKGAELVTKDLSEYLMKRKRLY